MLSGSLVLLLLLPEPVDFRSGRRVSNLQISVLIIDWRDRDDSNLLIKDIMQGS